MLQSPPTTRTFANPPTPWAGSNPVRDTVPDTPATHWLTTIHAPSQAIWANTILPGPQWMAPLSRLVWGQPRLVVTATHQTPGAQRVVNHVSQCLGQQSWLAWLGFNPKTWQSAFQKHLAVERACFEEPALASHAQYHGIYIDHHRLVPLHAEGTVACAVFRAQRLLTYALSPQQFITLQPGDQVMMLLPQAGTPLPPPDPAAFLSLWQAATTAPHPGATPSQQGYVMFTVPQGPSPWWPPSQWSPTRRALALFLLTWAIALWAAQWLNNP